MKWITHQAGAIVSALVLGLPPAGVAAAWAGAIAPDVIDQRVSRLAPTRKGRQKIFNRIHRGTSHWLGWWLACLALAAWAPLPWLAQDSLAGLAFGGVSHVTLDMCTTRGVPLLPFSRRRNVSLGLFSTGSLGEWLFLALVLCGGLVYLLVANPGSLLAIQKFFF